MRCLKSSFLYGGSRHHKKLKIFNLSFSSVLKFFSFSNSSTFQNLHCFLRFSSLAIYIYEFMSSTAFTYSYFFKLLFLLSECDRTLPPLCYTQPNLFTNSSCAFYLKLVQSLHCVLVSWRNCERNFKTNLIQIFGFTAQTVPHPTMHYFIHPRSYTISSAQYVGDTCRVKKKGQGHVRPKIFGRTVFTVAINTPLPSLLHLLRSVAVSRSSSPQTLAPPLLHRRRWGRASLPRPRRRRTRAGCGNLHSAAAVAVSLCQVRAWEI